MPNAKPSGKIGRDVDEEMAARSIASLCGAITALAEIIQDTGDPAKKGKPHNVLTLGLSHSDGWLDQIMPKRLHVDSEGNASFGLRDE